MKDVPVNLPVGLEIAVVCAREDARDAFVSNKAQSLNSLAPGSIIGTSSLRRTAQLKSAFPDMKVVGLRGNVNTRLAKLDSGEYDAIILAAAGLIRLGFESRITQLISPELCLPAVGQGIVGIECRTDNQAIKQLIQPLHNLNSDLCLVAERSMNATLDGGCQVPVAGFAEAAKGQLRVRGLVGSIDGKRILRSEKSSTDLTLASAEQLGHEIAIDLLQQGAAEILESIDRESSDE
jgi:hydroxymethylbilane synthase